MYLPSLIEYIKLVALHEARIREADISGDRKVAWGSDEHIQDLQARIDDLSSWRAKQRRGSESRANYSRLISRLKNELSSAMRANQKIKQTTEKDV